MLDSEVFPADPGASLAAVEMCHRDLVRGETRLLQLAAHWADLHPGEAVSGPRLPGRESARVLGGEGTPSVASFAPAELGAAVETSTGGAEFLIADALDLRHRLPMLWSQVVAGTVRSSRARRVARVTRHLDREAAGRVDAELAGYISSLPWARFENLLEAAVLRADPEGADARAEQADAERFLRAGRENGCGLKLLVAKAAAGEVVWFVAMADRIAEILAEQGDPDPVDVRRSKAVGILARPAYALELLEGRTKDPAASRPRAVVYVHLNGVDLTRSGLADQAVRGAVARVEGLGAILLNRVRRLLGEHCQVLVTPVLDLADDRPVDAYEVPPRLAELLHHRSPADAFPYGVNLGRKQDHDHSVPYLPMEDGGPPEQTRIGNLDRLVRFHHNIRTHGGWQIRQPEPGTYLWRSRLGRFYLVNAAGTHPLGTGSFARRVWRAAEPPPRAGPYAVRTVAWPDLFEAPSAGFP